MTRIKGWTRLSADDLWSAWLKQHRTETEAIAVAIFTANRLVRDTARSTKRRFYSIKDEWIRRHQCYLIDGRRIRREASECWSCGGQGCDDCDYSGEYSSRWLYVHNFSIDGRKYSFHSYQVPSTLSDEAGEDKEAFGGQFSEEELADLPLPLSGLVRMLTYVAAGKWGMRIQPDGRYYPQSYIHLQAETDDGPTFRDQWHEKLYHWQNNLPTPVGSIHGR